ncbi:40S ribosomal protein S12 and pelota RNA binding domain-containing protein [Cryptosporidium canis]|uniref:40S ribosomal protein S12 n=1 Tax=Cryptosporidium canis TaxID=195482 RepID=A0A9D5HUL6_9CRYT|nr:40S ribosomal protein S12 and pelota RNA binding domain-containing protein [Cryptosporidium canis]
MSDVEIEQEGAQTQVEQEVVNDLTTAIRYVLKNSFVRGGLLRGLNEVVLALDSKKAQVCFLAESCEEDCYKQLVEALCRERGIPLIMVPDSKELGEMAGLCKVDREGNPRKVVGAASVAIVDYGVESEAYHYLQKHIAENCRS